MTKDTKLFFIYPLSLLGDFNLSLLLTSSILYGDVLNAEKFQIGLIGGFYGIVYIIMAALLGRLGDKIPRKISLILASVGQVIVTTFILFFADSVVDLIISQALMGICYGFYWPSIEAYVSENTRNSPESHQKGISNFCLSWSLGFMLGPLVAGILENGKLFEIGFWITFTIYILMFLIIIFGLPILKTSEKKNSTNAEDLEQPITIKASSLIQIILTVFIYAAISKFTLSFFTNYADRNDGLNWQGTEIGVLLFMFGLGRTVYFLLARLFESKFRNNQKRSNYTIVIISVCVLLVGVIRLFWPLLIIFLIIGFCCGLIYLSSLELLMIQEEKAKGSKAGLFESAVGFGSFSPIIAGFFAEIYIILPFFIFSGVTLVVYAINVVLIKKLK